MKIKKVNKELALLRVVSLNWGKDKMRSKHNCWRLPK